jgi:hypothetical protein
MNEQTVTVRKTFTYQLQPTARQEQAMACVLRRCRERSHAGLHARRAAWQRCGVSSSAASQNAQLPAIKEVRPDYHELHAQVLPRCAHPPGSGGCRLLAPRQGR